MRHNIINFETFIQNYQHVGLCQRQWQCTNISYRRQTALKVGSVLAKLEDLWLLFIIQLLWHLYSVLEVFFYLRHFKLDIFTLHYVTLLQ